jgi:hypothetical protein
MKWYRQIFLDWNKEYSWMRVAAAPVVAVCVLGIGYSVATHWGDGIAGCAGLLGVIFTMKWLQTKEEAKSEEGK